MKVTEINPELRKVLAAIASKKNWDVEGWDATDSAIAVVRTILEITGQKDLLAADEHGRNERKALVAAIFPLLNCGAPINLRRGLLVSLGLAPEMAEKGKAVEREY